ncbi:MAG: hypothetical protein ABEH89_00100 [bacterium]
MISSAVSREEATPIPPVPEKYRQVPEFYRVTDMERPGEQPVLIYTAWGSSLSGYLRKIGYSDTEIYRIDLALFQGWGTQAPTAYVPNLNRQVKSIHDEHGKKVDIIAHSLGGLTARWYVEQTDGAQYVDDLITLAAPNQGGLVFYGLYMFPAGRAMVPSSSFLQTLNGGSLAPDVEYTAVWSNIDEVFLFNLFRSDGAKLPQKLIDEHGNARNVWGGSTEHIELAVSWQAFKRYYQYLD